MVHVVQVCLDFRVAFEDAGVGDYWTLDEDQPASGVRIEVDDDDASQGYWLDETTGCAVVVVHASPPDQAFTIRAFTKAEVYGVPLEAHPTDSWDQQGVGVVTWANVDARDPTFHEVLPLTQTFLALAVGTWVVGRSTFNVDQDPSRACCLDGAATYQPDGTCTSTPDPDDDYVRIPPPIHFFTGPALGCGASQVDGHPAVGVSCPQKWTLAHELGHVLVDLRMGGRDDTDDDAPMDGCIGDWKDVDEVPALVAETDRGHFSKEYMSEALREGWATFVEIWAWNDPEDTDCARVIRDDTGKDFDLDGTIDEEIEMDCIGTAYPGTDPADAPMDDANWLADLEAADDDDVDGVQCSADPDGLDYEFNRGTVYDVAKMLWHLVERDTDPLTPEQLSDVYVDSCARDWAAADVCVDGNVEELPLSRLLIAADANGVFDDVLGASLDYLWDLDFAWGPWPTCD